MIRAVAGVRKTVPVIGSDPHGGGSRPPSPPIAAPGRSVGSAPCGGDALPWRLAGLVASDGRQPDRVDQGGPAVLAMGGKPMWGSRSRRGALAAGIVLFTVSLF